MAERSEQYIEKWKKNLLDLGKRNKLIAFHETKRSSLKLVMPEIEELYNAIVKNGTILEFLDVQDDEEYPEQIEDKQILSNRKKEDQNKTLLNIRNKAKSSIDEQGVNILYIAFGFLDWTESEHSSQHLLSPIVLVPVSLTIESITSPFKISLYEDDVVVNPTLSFKLENDCGINLPSFEDSEDISILEYLTQIENIVSANGWTVTQEAQLSLFSFLKINMYKDLDKNKEKLLDNPVIKGLAGDKSEIYSLPEEYDNYDFDKNERPVDVFQVVDADSSQQDAILYAKNGISFVLQGPPGTGKSQTITNIISECLAEGKKVLFVSEKMAALEVVYNRLKEVGLADFCLRLHSHKANKKEVLSELGRTLDMNRITVKDEAMYELELLQTEKQKLNQYDSELHEICKPLGKSVYDISGKLSKLANVPEMIFPIESVADMTIERLNSDKFLLKDFSNTIGKMSSEYDRNPWKGSNVKTVTHELRHDIEKNLKTFISNIDSLYEAEKDLDDEFGLSIHPSLDLTQQLVEILTISELCPGIPISWVYESDIAPLIDDASKYKALKTEHDELHERLLSEFDESIFAIPAQEILQSFEDVTQEVLSLLNSKNYENVEEVLSNQNDNISGIQSILNTVKDLQNALSTLEDMLDIKYPPNFNETQNVLSLLRCILLSPNPSEDWFDNGKFTIIQSLFYEAKNVYWSLKQATENILGKYDKEIFTIDCSAMLGRFRTEYTSFFKIFKPSYKADKKLIQSFAKNQSVKLTDDSIINLLNDLKETIAKKSWINEKHELMSSLFGKRYLAEYTDWAALEEAIENFNAITNWFHGERVPDKLKQLLLNSEANKILTDVEKQITEDFASNVKPNISKLLKLDVDVAETSYEVIIEKTKQVSEYLTKLYDLYREMSGVSKENCSCKNVLNGFKYLSRYQDIDTQVALRENSLRDNFDFFFNGINTDWENVINALIWAKSFRELKENYNLPDAFINSICSSADAVLKAKSSKITLTERYSAIQNEYKYFLSLFDDTKADFNSMYLPDLSERAKACVNNLAELEEWIDFRNCREKCKEVGLDDYTSQITDQHIDRKMILPIFLKRFYRLWLDAMIEKKPAIASFRRNNFEQTIGEFQKLDMNQMRIARLRVKERLASQLPDVNRPTSSVDEIGILKRELRKQRRIMPIRKLFAAIPNLLITLKPCLMMSPLSVSLFLDADTYKFDVVVFDEASQICTEEAVGAIYRSSQVIIAGDDKQLPPTNFFSASKTDADYDTETEEEDDDSDSYESVLDEALTVLPERSLLWHYRSRHEDLIAFSNAKIYKNLVTFPSSIEREHDVGVEYVYVSNGIYDRSGKRDNQVEAQKVAEIVFQHFQKFPQRSLGVVTFSGSQQQAVEAAIRQIRLKDQRYEDFFNEEKEEAFFIKNLENVQGDERDTIILSIGYAKDQNGIMYMNFGPLTKSGGYRRLNVAITRAKYNVKLVGSILPTDISAEVTSDGAKMLRSYIDFAINGKSAIVNELQVPDSVNVESPFEESVYDFLVANGYNVATQVGCSGFRIDMAIRHPKLSGRFVLGIECDGATYHSARTARERDRLRQMVLENIGWKIYRIWSTDWIKDQNTEGRKLIQNIENAMASFYEGDFLEEDIPEPQADENAYIEEKSPDEINPDVSQAELYGFKEYKETNISDIKRNLDDDATYCGNVLRYVIQNEYPIHFELLCKRVAILFGNQKATGKVRDYVSLILNGKLKNEIIQKNDFCWPVGVKEAEVRIPDGESGSRPISYISNEELAVAMYQIADKSFGIKKDDLFVATARLYGFNRTGGNIVFALDDAFKMLLCTDKVQLIEEKVSITRG